MLGYELSRRLPSPSGGPGSPERPLSPQGQRGYSAYWTTRLVHHLRSIFSPPLPVPSSPEDAKKKARRSRGWEGEISPPAPVTVALPKLSGGRGEGLKADVATSLSELAAAVWMRAEDVAWALDVSGLAGMRVKREDGTEELVITREAVEAVAERCGVKPRGVLDLAHVLI